MSAVREELIHGGSETIWSQLAALEELHHTISQTHERVLRSLDEAVLGSDSRNLRIAWNEYRAVVTDLSRVTADIESLRLAAI